LKPDWVIVMDGHNDAGVPCGQGAGVGTPLGWPTLLYLTRRGSGLPSASPLLETLATHSAIVRLISGIKADAAPRSLSSDLYFDEDNPDKGFRVKTKGLK